jgi:hypothetical protein
VIAAVAIALAIPWLSPLSFGLHVQGWHTGQSGTTYLTVGHAHKRLPMSTAWAANVPYRDPATSDPPNQTLQHLPTGGVVIWAMIQPSMAGTLPPDHRRISAHYALADAYHFPCCDGVGVRGGSWELYGFGPKHTYSVIVRIYWGSPPTKTMKAEAQRALDTMRLPRASS